MRMTPKNIALLIGALLVVLIGIGVYQALQPKNPQTNVPPQKVTIQLPANNILDIYQSSEEALHGQPTDTSGDPLMSIEQSKQIELKQGVYTIQTRQNPDYKPFSDFLVVGQSPIELDIPLEYTDQKLQSLLGAELPMIQKAITTANSKITDLYTMERGWLYNQGDWYATKLIYKGGDVNTTDTLRLVAHKKDGAWQLVTTPPDITVSGPKYPDIPDNVLTDINNFR